MEPIEPPGGWPTGPPFPPVGVRVVPVAGCLRRLVLLIVILVALAVLAVFALFSFGGRIVLGARGVTHPVLAVHSVPRRDPPANGGLAPGVGVLIPGASPPKPDGPF